MESLIFAQYFIQIKFHFISNAYNIIILRQIKMNFQYFSSATIFTVEKHTEW